MHNIFFKSLLLLFFITSFFGFKSNATEKENSISLNLLGIPLGGYQIKYRRQILPYLDISVPVRFQSIKLLLLPGETVGFLRSFQFGLYSDLSFSSGIGILFHYPDSAWYVEPGLEFGYSRIDYTLPTGTEHLFVLKPKLLFGYQKKFPSGLYLDAAIGIDGLIFLPVLMTNSTLMPEIILALGYTW